MHVLELAKRRKTVRKFLPDAPPKDIILKAVEVAKEAPSGMNAQPWHFLIVAEPSTKAKIREVCEELEREFYRNVKGELAEWLKERDFSWRKPFLSEAPYLILVFGIARYPYWLQSTWIAVGYLLLALEELNLATVTYTPPKPRKVEETIKAPKNYRLQTIMPVGYSADPKPKYERKKLEEIVSFEDF
ncbi:MULTISPECIES: nitroreductase family protein [unclassified Archaeoglobus]|jgi:nitroreductase|uniref:nitroreductase family protein n=1 Tax=unclassified Archaeoglobus TaxID=2643606 RepID=UPI0025BB6A86|nr:MULTISPECIES: nitroreductase family protein [unclassified Archaeoglobus]